MTVEHREAEPDDPGSARTELAPSPGLADRLARADLKARLFGAPAESTRVGRYAVLRKLGAGGMGVVYAAFDEELDRKVAIKLVHPGLHDPDARARSRREAQALARLSHPNVVQIFEVGEYAGQVYLAMEFIAGHTLRDWQHLAPRGWRDTVAMYVQAGRGLAAAHARGLVHRDFKPDNVLVGDEDQRPRVLDFGLARVPGPTRDLSPRTGDTRGAMDLSPGTADARRAPALPPGTADAHGHDLSLGTANIRRSPDLSPGTADARGAQDLSPGTADARAVPDLSPATADVHRPPGLSTGTADARAVPDLPLGTADARAVPDISPGPADARAAPDLSPGTADIHRPLDLSLGTAEPARLTTPGAVLGTPAYMAPEQLVGGEADARSDVFSFCAALYEALHGARPFAGDTREALYAAIRRGALTRPQRPAELPAWLQRVLERGLAADPAARWPTMEPLLAALGRDPTRWGRRTALAGLGLLVVGGGLLGLLELSAQQQAAALAAEQARAAQVTAELARTEAARAGEQRRSEARRLASQSARQAEQDPVARLLLAVEAVAQHTRAGTEPIVEAEQALLDALDSPRSTPFTRAGATVVDAIAGSPDGAWIATGERDGAVTLWRSAAPREPLPLLASDGHAVHALAFSPDGTALAASRVDAGGPLVWTLPVPKDSQAKPVPSDIPAPTRWPSPISGLRDLEWSPRGESLLARAGADVLILHADAEPRMLAGHTAPVRRAAWSRDGAQIVTASADGTARVWPVRGGPAKIVTLPGTPRRGLWSAEFSPDGRELALASADHTAAIVPLHGGPALRLRGHTDEVYAAVFRPDGDLLTVSRDDTARVWARDGSSTTVALAGHAEALGGARPGPAGDLLLGTPPGGPAWVWQVDRPGPPLVLHGHRGSVVAARFSADGRRILTASADGSARIWRFADDPDLLRGHDAGIEGASFAPDGRSIVTASMDGTTRVWPRDDGRPLLLRGHREGSSVTAAFSPDSARLASAGSDGLARLWSLTTAPPTLLATLPAEPERGAALLDLAWSPDGEHLALAADDGRIHLFSGFSAEGRPRHSELLRDHAGPVRALAFTATRLASAGDDARVVLWDLSTRPVPSRSLGTHERAIRSLAFGPGDTLLSAGDDATVRIWSLVDERPPRVLHGHTAAIWRVRPFAGGAVSASADGTARVWPAVGETGVALTGHADAVWVADPSPDGAAILTTSSDGTARLWRRRGDEWSALLLPQRGTAGAGEPDHTLWTGGFSPDGRHALTAGADGLARVAPVLLGDQISEACARAGRNLDPGEWTRLVGDAPRQRSCPAFE